MTRVEKIVQDLHNEGRITTEERAAILSAVEYTSDKLHGDSAYKGFTKVYGTSPIKGFLSLSKEEG